MGMGGARPQQPMQKSQMNPGIGPSQGSALGRMAQGLGQMQPLGQMMRPEVSQGMQPMMKPQPAPQLQPMPMPEDGGGFQMPQADPREQLNLANYAQNQNQMQMPLAGTANFAQGLGQQGPLSQAFGQNRQQEMGGGIGPSFAKRAAVTKSKKTR